MRFWFSKMLWSTKKEITWISRRASKSQLESSFNVWYLKDHFHRKTKQNKNCSFGRLNNSTRKQVEIYRSKYINVILKEAVFMPGVTVEINKRIRDEPEGHLNLAAQYYMLRTAFCGYSKGNWRNFPVVSNPRVEKEFGLYE